MTGGAEAAKVFIEKPIAHRASDAEPLNFESIPVEIVASLDARLIAEYDTRVLLEVPDGQLESFEERARALGYGSYARPEFDRIRINGYDFVSDGGRPDLPPGLEIERYEGEIGLYLIQMVGPPKQEWVSDLRDSADIVRYFSENTFLVRACPGALDGFLSHPEIQYIGVHQPAFKVQQTLLDLEQQAISVVIQLDEGQDIEPFEDWFEQSEGRKASVSRGGIFVNVRLKLNRTQIVAAARRPEVLWIEAYVAPAPSDERHAMVVADQITGPRPALPTTGLRYESWLGAKGFCVSSTLGECITYDTKIAVFDTGLDSNSCYWGLSDPAAYDPVQGTCTYPWVKNRHPDFGGNGSESRQSNFFCIQETIDPNANPPEPDFCQSGDLDDLRCFDYISSISQYRMSFTDSQYGVVHGTSVASLAAGSAFEGGYDQDELGYYKGWGMAPRAQLVTAKVLFHSGGNDFGTTEYQCVMSRSHGVGARFANNSWNQQGGSWGQQADETGYSFLSQLMDSLVRDADPYDQTLIEPETIIFSAGNLEDVAYNPDALVQAPGNAKNVISVGASEGWQEPNENRPCCSQFAGCHSCSEDGGDDVGNIFGLSLRSTEDGRIKPDLVAPGTRLRAALSMDENSDGLHQCFGGTSGAAPLVTGSAVLVDAWLRSQPTPIEASPAMLKAMLVAHADDLYEGKDWLPEVAYQTGFEILGHSPSAPQGWGRVNLNTLIPDNGGTPSGRLFYDEDHETVNVQRRFSGSLTTWSDNLEVADSNKDVIVVLAYTDKAGALGASTAAVNNLNLQVVDGGGPSASRYYGNKFILGTEYSRRFPGFIGWAWPDSLNNVEVIRIPTGEIVDEDFTVVVSAATLGGVGVPGLDGGGNNQDFALYVVNAFQEGGGQ